MNLKLYMAYLYLYLYILGPTARWCPMPPHFFTRWVSMLLGLAQVSCHGLQLVLVSIAFPLSPSIYRCFPFTLHPPLDFIRVSFLRPTYLHPFDRSFTSWWWVSRLGTGSGTRCCGPRAGMVWSPRRI